MNEKQKRMIEKLGLNISEFEPRKETIATTIEITREDFEMLDVEQEVIYHIYELDGTMTIKKGINQ